MNKRRIKKIVAKQNYTKISKEKFDTCHSDILLSENNRLTYTYKHISSITVLEVTCVSLDIKIEGKWETIIYYDSFHNGLLHRHTKIAYNIDADITDSNQLKEVGEPKELLEWSINDIKNYYIKYKQNFIKRNVELLEGIEIELY